MTTEDTSREDATTASPPDAAGAAETDATAMPTPEGSTPEPGNGTPNGDAPDASSPLGEDTAAVTDAEADADADAETDQDAEADAFDDATGANAAEILDAAPISVDALPDLAAATGLPATGHVSTGTTGLPAQTTSWEPPAAPAALSEPATPLPEPVPPRTRWAGIIWGLFFAALASFGLWTLVDPLRRQGLVDGAEGITPGTVAGILLLAIGVLVLVAGLAGLFRRAQRRLTR